MIEVTIRNMECIHFNLGKPALPERGPPSVLSGFSISVQPAKPTSPIRFLCEQ